MSKITDTPNLLIRHFIEDDSTELFPLLADSEVMEHSFSGVLDQQASQAWLAKRLAQYEHPGFSINAIILKSQEKMIGFAGIVPLDLDGHTEIELIFRFPHQYWEYAQEAAEAIRDHSFNHLGFSRIMCMPTHQNQPKIDIALNIGMSYEHDSVHRGQQVEVYGMLRPTRVF